MRSDDYDYVRAIGGFGRVCRDARKIKPENRPRFVMLVMRNLMSLIENWEREG